MKSKKATNDEILAGVQAASSCNIQSLGRMRLTINDTLRRMDCHNKRIVRLERLTNDQEIRRVSFCSHVNEIKSMVYLESTGSFLALKYKCIKCKKEFDKPHWFLSRREKKALRTLGVILK